MIVMRIAITPSLNASSLVLDTVYPGRLGDGVPAAKERPLAWLLSGRACSGAGEGDRAGEVGHRSLDECRPWCRGGAAARSRDEGCGERRGAGERCRADPADL